MSQSTPRSSFISLAVVFFFQWCAAGMWNVPFSNILKAAGMAEFIAPAFACNAVAAFVSPLLIGSLADRGFPPVTLLRWLFWTAGIMLSLTFLSIDRGWSGSVMLVGMQLHAFCFSPTSSLVTTIAMAELSRPSQEYGPLRMWGTFGWIAAGWIVSWVLASDASPVSGYAAGATSFALGFATYWLPAQKGGAAGGARNWKELLGLDALQLLRHPDHRTILLTVTLFGIPMAAFYPYTPLHLRALGFEHASATMSLGQLSEVIGLLFLAALTRQIRLKWVLMAGLCFGILRYGLFALNSRATLLLGISLHGACYTFYNITAQIYLAERVDTLMRARAQALYAMLTGGVSNLLGYLGTGLIFQLTSSDTNPRWTLYWGLLCAAAIAVTMYFFLNYHGVGKGFFKKQA
ncbi:MAG: MFS transporter [Nibricoccus sp.]